MKLLLSGRRQSLLSLNLPGWRAIELLRLDIQRVRVQCEIHFQNSFFLGTVANHHQTSMLSTSEFLPGHPSYTSLILIEPTIVTRETYMAELEDRTAQMDFVVTATATRRDAWKSREDASTWLSKRFPWNMWDPRVVKVYTVSTMAPEDSTTFVVQHISVLCLGTRPSPRPYL
jgi:hypothetical protein